MEIFITLVLVSTDIEGNSDLPLSALIFYRALSLKSMSFVNMFAQVL